MELVEQPSGRPDAWDAAFAAFHARFAPFFYRREVRERSARYLRGLLGPVERKNGWQLAEAVGEADPQGMQRLLYAARWDADAVRDELICFVAESFGDADGILVLDETGFLKKGSKSVGVQRQYTGTAGKTENCQVGVFLTYVGPQGHAFEEVAFRTKPELAWAMLEHAWTLGIPGRSVTADTVHGQDPLLRARLDGIVPDSHYVLAVPAPTPVWMERPPATSASTGAVRMTRTWTAHTAATAATTLAATAWRRITVAAGAKGPRIYDWAAVRVAVGERGWPGPERWLLVPRSVGDPGERANYLSNAPPETPLGTLARVAGARWPIEQGFEESKGEAGLDHYEVRRWDSWHRHITLALLAHAFLAELRRQSLGGSPTRELDLDAPLVPLGVPEARRPPEGALPLPARSAAARQAWSLWRRHHQAIARRCHYRRRRPGLAPPP
jgi:SRSO17 transposase